MRVLFCFVFFAAVGGIVKGTQYDYPSYWNNDYDSFYDAYDDAGDDSNENTELKQTEKPVDAAQDVQIEEKTEQNDKFDVMEDYQIEDNRSDSGEKEQEEKVIPDEEPMPDDAPENYNNEEHAVLPLEDKEESEEQSDDDNQHLDDEDVKSWSELIEDNVAPLPAPTTEDVKVSENDLQDRESEDTQILSSTSEKNLEAFEDMDKIIDETNQLLQESDEGFEADEYDNSDEQDKSDEDLFSENNDETDEDTPEKVYADLNADIDKLFETLDKLSDDTDEEEIGEDTVKDYEEKYGKPYNEDVVLSWRNAEADAADPEVSTESHETQGTTSKDEVVEEDEESDDYENIDDSNLSELFAENAEEDSDTLNETDDNDEEKFEDIDVNKTPEIIPEQVETDSDTSNDNDEQKLVKENDVSDKEQIATTPIMKIDEGKEAADYVDNYDDSADSEPNAGDDIDSVIKQIFSDDIKEPQSYGNDGLVDEKQPKNNEAVEFEAMETNNTNIEENIEQKTISVDELNSAELSDLMTQFAAAHSEDLDVNSETFSKYVAPIHITLSVDEPTVVTSPDYPNPYPTNNIIDWIFDGPGTGIEMNITNFAVNGALGDYLLVKPGGLDESGKEGLIFSYRLTSERRYRFTDVNRMFVRFEAKPGFQFMTGFSFSVKLMWPLPQVGEELPEPESVLSPPEHTLILNLAGLTLPQFNGIKEEFRELLADMAKVYIRNHNIEQGMNTTLEVTQIINTAVCNIRWPNYDTCVEVEFGVPLQYEDSDEQRLNEEDLQDMWTSNIKEEQFASRLRSLGIKEYAIPNDRTVLIVWLVIALGVLISMSMLAFALWRFSCFEDYTRMKMYSDTDSIKNEKRNLDLYPTPHQTLPPLYSENDYKWADDKYDDSTRVDMGGFSNKNYVRDELFDLDSDEDVITTRDRKGVISPRDFYDV